MRAQNLGPHLVADEHEIRSRRGEVLAAIEWYLPWRKHVIAPNPSAVFDASCLAAISAHLARLDRER